MTRKNKIIYWVATLWLSLGMVSTAFVQLVKMKEEVEKTSLHMGYPTYFLTIIATWKLLGVIALLIPKYPLLKEWAYSGFFFLMSGAIFSHLACGDPAIEFFGPALLLILTALSWYYRPASKRVTFVFQ